MDERRIESLHSHLVWDRSLEPVLHVERGSEVTLELLDASGGQIAHDDGPDAIDRFDFARVNPCTGPVAIDDLDPGDGLVVTILDITLAPWAWTANFPGFGLLAEDFPRSHLWISKVEDGTVHLPIGVGIKSRAMIGTIGVAPEAHRPHPILVPAGHGGNMDISQMGVGTQLHLPVLVPGALFGGRHARGAGRW